MKFLKKLLVILLIFSVCVSSYAFWWKKKKPDGDKKIKIQFAISPREVGSVVSELIDGFQKDNPNIEVEWLKVPGVPNEQHNLYVTNMTAQADQPDVLSADVIWPGEFIANNWAAPLNEYFSKKEQSQYLDGMMNSVTVGDKIYGIPLYTNAIHLFYRKDLLDKYGYSVPKTWEELINTANDIVAKENNPDLNGYISMWAQIEGLFMNYLQFFWGAGGSFFKNGKVNVNSPEGKEALQTMLDMIYKDKIAPKSILTYKPNDAMALFRQKRVVFMVVQDFVWTILNADDSPVKGNVGMTRVPYFKGNEKARTVCMGGWILMVNPYSKNKEASAKFIKYVTSYESGLKLAKTTGSMPAIKNIEKDKDLLAAFPITKQLYEDFSVGDVRPSAQTGAKYSEISHVMQKEITAALVQNKSADQALKDAQDEIEKILK